MTTTFHTAIVDQYTDRGIDRFIARAWTHDGHYTADSAAWANEYQAIADAESQLNHQIRREAERMAAQVETEATTCPTCAGEGDCPDCKTQAEDDKPTTSCYTYTHCQAYRCDEPATHGPRCCYHYRAQLGLNCNCETQTKAAPTPASAAPYFPLETVIAARLEAETIRYANEVLTSRAAGDKAAAKEAQRAANSFAKALLYWQEGVRPEQTPAGNWMLPSQRGVGEAPHLLHRSGDWCCSCQAGESWHWAKALIIGVEIAYDTDDLPFDCITRLRTAIEETEAVLWSEAEARQRRYEEACRQMDELYA
jgi:hypothetical protein